MEMVIHILYGMPEIYHWRCSSRCCKRIKEIGGKKLTIKDIAKERIDEEELKNKKELEELEKLEKEDEKNSENI